MPDLEAHVEQIAVETARAGQRPYTSLDRVAEQLCKEVDEFDAADDQNRARAIVRDIAERKLVYWHGLIGPVDEECLAEWLSEEADSQLVRERLIGQINQVRQKANGGASA